MRDDARAGSPIIPTIRYRDALAAIDWLCRAFGFERHLVVPGENGTISHAQLTFGNGMIMLGSARADDFGKIQMPLADLSSPVSQSAYVIVEDVDGHYERAAGEGAIIVSEPEDQHYGGRLYLCRDSEGNLWSFGSYNPWSAD